MATLPLTDRVAIVTGSGRGLGRAIALGLAQNGARVALVARTGSEIDAVAKEVERLGGVALPLVADLGDSEQPVMIATRVEAELGHVDIVINNAAVIWPLGPTPDIDPAVWESAAQVNLIGPMRLTLATVKGMLWRKWGRIVNVSSGVAANPTGLIGGNAYTATKAALESHTLNLATEVAGTGVTANVFRPGTVDTSMQTWIRDQDPAVVGEALHQRFVGLYERRALMTPESSAGALLSHVVEDETGQIWELPY